MRSLALSICLLVAVAGGCAGVEDRKPAAVASPLEPATHLPADVEGMPEAQPGLPEITGESTLSDYLTYAALNNPGLQASFDRWKAALEKVPQVDSLPDPRFTYGYFIQSVETRVGPQRNSFLLTQLFPWFGKLALRGGQAMEAANAERERFEAAKLKLFYMVKDAYYEYHYLSRAVEVTEANLQLLNHIVDVVQARYASGEGTYADVVRSQVELGKIEDRVRTLEDLRQPTSAKLNAALGRNEQTPLPWPGKAVEEKTELTDEQMTAMLREKNPTLKALDHTITQERKGIELARKQYFPDVTLGAQVIDTGDARTPGVSDSGKDPVIASVSINVPVWYKKYRAGVKEARYRYTAAKRERQDQENTLISDLKMALYKYRDAERRIDLYRTALIPKAQQAIEVGTQGFEAGNVSFVNLFDAQRTLLELELAYERAFADRAQRLAELEMLVGKEIPLSQPAPMGEPNPG
jgi:cobalt-zinc-cadmium efflux system outer membrane protein